jgi:hypothetical protein
MKKLDQGVLGLRILVPDPGQDVTDALVQAITLPNGMYMIL